MCKIQFEFNTDAEREAYLNGYELAKKMFKRQNGKWLQREDKEYKDGGYNFCTACQYRFSFGAYPLIYEADYCPNCGADMRVKEGDEK